MQAITHENVGNCLYAQGERPSGPEYEYVKPILNFSLGPYPQLFSGLQ